MRAFHKVRLIPNFQNLPFETAYVDLKGAEDFYYHRRFFAVLGFLMSLLLLIWGYVIMPGGLLFWVWLAVAGIGIGGAGFLFARQVRDIRGKLEKAAVPIESPHLQWAAGLILIVVAGLVVNLLVVFANPQPLRFDAWGYSDQGYDIAQQGYKADAIRTPAYPLFVAAIYKLGGDSRPLPDTVFGIVYPANRNMVLLWVAQALLLSLIAIITYALTARLLKRDTELDLYTKETDRAIKKIYWGRPWSLVAAGLVAFCPFLWGYTGTSQTEIYATLWLTLAVYFWVRAMRQRIAFYYLLCGLALALTLETRPTFVYLPLLVMATFAIFNGGNWRFFGPVLLLAPLLLLLAPPFAANLRDWDEPTPLIAGDLSTYQTAIGVINVTTGGMPRYQKLLTPANDRMTQEDMKRLQAYVPSQQQPDKAKRHAESDYWKKYFSNYVSSQPLEFAGTVLKRGWFQWSQHFVFPYYDPAYWDFRFLTDNLNRLYLILGLFGLGIALLNSRYRFTTMPLYLTILYLIAVNMLVRTEFRYTLPIYPLLLIFGTLAVYELRFTVYDLMKKEEIRSSDRKSFIIKILGFDAAFGFIAILSLALPLIPGTNTQREKALDALYISQQETEACFFKDAQTTLNRAVALAGQEAEIVKWQKQFPKEVDYTINALTFRIDRDTEGKEYNNYRCRGDALRIKGENNAARADFQQYLKLAPPEARERSKIESWLRELGQAS